MNNTTVIRPTVLRTCCQSLLRCRPTRKKVVIHSKAYYCLHLLILKPKPKQTGVSYALRRPTDATKPDSCQHERFVGWCAGPVFGSFQSSADFQMAPAHQPARRNANGKDHRIDGHKTNNTIDEQKLVFETPHTSRGDETRLTPTNKN